MAASTDAVTRVSARARWAFGWSIPNAAAHAASKKRLRAGVIEAIRVGLEKDLAGWQKQFL